MHKRRKRRVGRLDKQWRGYIVTMPRSKDPNKGKDSDQEDDENVSEPQQKSMFDYFKRKRRGRPKRRANLATDKVETKRSKKQTATLKAPPKAANMTVPKADDGKKNQGQTGQSQITS